tara:strand:- start:827 stop:1327 length:501 start_codon:yes stop_codon:yes gene_type:complete
MEPIQNKVANSGLINLEMKSFHGNQKRSEIDIKNWLYEGLILKEKLFRNNIKLHDWSQYKNHYVSVFCSEDTIIPVWAYMLVVSKLQPYTKNSILGNRNELEKFIFNLNIKNIDSSLYQNKRVLIKGCSETYIPEESFVTIVNVLSGKVKSIMFGEACSNVPILKS